MRSLRMAALKQYRFSPSKWVCCMSCVYLQKHHLYGSFLLRLCAVKLSYDIAVCDVSARCLAGPDDLHDLASFEAVVPRNGIGDLYSW